MPLDPSDHVAGHRTVPGSPQRRDGADGAIRLELPTRAPFAGAVLHHFLAVHAVAGTEAAAADGRFACTLRLPHGAAVAELTLTDTATARVWLTDLRDLAPLLARLRRLCDLDADPVAVDDVLRRDPPLAPLVQATPGLRLHGTCDPTELAGRALLGQQISIAPASRSTEHLIPTHGEPLPADLARTASDLQTSDPSVRVLSNSDGTFVTAGADYVDRLVKQVTSPVRWDLCQEAMLGAGITGMIELVPGGTLTGLARRAMKGVETVAIKSAADLDGAREFAAAHA